MVASTYARLGPSAALKALPRLPTPAYVYDLAEVRRNHALLRAALPEGTGLYYSLKANPHPGIGRVLAEDGARAEVCSSGELAAALDAGWTGARMLYTGPGKRDAEIRTALRHGVRQFSVDSPHALDQLDQLAAETGTSAVALLRVNDDHPVPGQGLVMTGTSSQFGADLSWVLAEPERFAGRHRVELAGLHLYMGTNLTEVEALLDQFARALASSRTVADALAAHGVRLRILDLGGGFGAPFARAGATADLTALRAPLTALLDADAPGWRDGTPEVMFESGRYLVGTSGTLLCTVLDVKRSQGKDVVVLESGINHLGGNSGLRRLPPLIPQLLHDGEPGEPILDALVTGPLCTPLDTWNRNAALPALRPGDVVGVPNVGAYGLSASLIGFLGHPLPVEVVIDGDHPAVPATCTRLVLNRTTISPQE
ncbi:alanine racemase [Amycolatopsis sp. WGS_07]|uniref:alanine racemase n=1 Tax=Amycolatopsis sp. WGS_07 TaxID=3076764 RepID=UPI00387357BF